MRINSFEWDSLNKEHIARHNVLPEEVEEIFLEKSLYRKTKDGKYLAYGQTFDGRYLFAVFTIKEKSKARIITARDMEKKELKNYKNYRGLKK